MNKKWWYSVGEDKQGPVNKAKLHSLFQNRRVSGQTLVWTQGMAAWQPMQEVDELSDVIESAPPPLPVRSARQKLVELQAAGPWRRLFARYIDLVVLSLIVGYSLGLILAYYYPAFGAWIQLPGSELTFNWLALPVVLIAEGLIFAVFGNTLGKAILGIVVTSSEAVPVSARQYFRRLPGVWWAGLGTGFPFVSLFTLFFQYRSVKARGHASYDTGKFNVKGRKLGPLRIIFAALIIVILLGMLVVFNMASQHMGRTEHRGVSWQNPITEHRTLLPSGWVYEPQINDTGQHVSIFASPRADIVLIFADEAAGNLGLVDYVDLWLDAVYDEMRFHGVPLQTTIEGFPALTITGQMTQATKNPVQATFIKQDENVWRTVIILDNINLVPQQALNVQKSLFRTVR